MSTPILPKAVWQSGTNENSIPANDNAMRDEIMLGAIISDTTDAQPSSPSEGDAYIITGSATGTQWETFTAGDVTIYKGGTWYAFAPVNGMRVNVAGTLKWWNGSAYADIGGSGGSSVLDVSTPSNASGTVTLDFGGKSRYAGSITLGANVTTLAFSNLPGAGKYAEYELHIAQDGTGSRTFAIPASHKALGGSDTAIASTANAVTVLTASTVDNGTTWRYAMQESA